MFGQWFFTSSLLGQFVNYDVNVTQVSSYNNPDLSLISAANIHQLVHTINVPSNDSANPIAFLSTDVPNLGNNPDAIYVANGTKHSSFVAQNATVIVINDSTLRLTVTPLIKGWNYKSVANPYANKTLKNVVNENSNTNVSLRNVWLTDRTLLEGQDPIYDNRIHIADDVQDSIQSYILTFNAEPNKRLAVDAIIGVPDTVATIPVQKVTVHFNKAINISSFTKDDVTIRCQGVVLNVNSLVINAINDSTFELDITAITDSNGYYSLTVQTNAITDKEGFNGVVGFVTGWNQFADNLQINAVANPVVGGSINPSIAQQPFGSTIQLKAHQAIGYKFVNWTIDNVTVSLDSILNHLVTSSKLITANFDKRKCILNVVKDDVKGNATGSSSGVYEFGNIISASVTANAGYLFLGWKLNDILVSTNPSFTFTINKDVKLEPTFKTKVNPVLEWDSPLVLTCSNSLSTALNATANVSGNFVYNPALGTFLNNSSYTLYVTFTPNDTFNFNVVMDSVVVSTNYIQVVTTSSNIENCSSVLLNGITYNSSAFVRDTLRNLLGCDSVITNTTIIITPITATIINNTLIGCNSVVFKGTTFTNSTIVRDTVKSVQGCDSIITNTSIVITPITITTINNTLSGCNNVLFKGIIFSNSTIVRDTVKSVKGCDSIITNTNIVITPIIATIFNNTLSGCKSVIFKGQIFLNSTTLRDTLKSVQGCDSIISNTNIVITPIIATIFNNTLSGCNSLIFKGTTFSNSTIVSDTLKSIQGCDSIIINTNIVISVPSTPSVSISSNTNFICAGIDIVFTATAFNAGNAPIFRWRKNGLLIGTGLTFTLIAGTFVTNDTINCELVSNNSCQLVATTLSNKIKVVISSNAAAGDIINYKVGGVVTKFSLCKIGDTLQVANYNTTLGLWSITNANVTGIIVPSFAFGRLCYIIAKDTGNSTILYSTKASSGCSGLSKIQITVAPIAAPASITGVNAICVGATAALNTVTTNGVWSSISGAATVNNTGVILGTSVGKATIKYTVSNIGGCSAFELKAISVNSLPATPSIGYAAPFSNPQAGAPTGGFCRGKIFGLVGSPLSGTWSSTGCIGVTASGIATINTTGAGSLTYTTTSTLGCSNSRTMTGTGFICAGRGNNDNQSTSPIPILKLLLYPNPAKAVVNFSIQALVGISTIVVTDLYGKKIITQSASMGINQINIAKLSKGIYLVSLITNNQKVTSKLVVE